MVNTTTTSKTSIRKKIFLRPCGAKDLGNIVRKFHSTKRKAMFFIYKK
jgi:hypothetical protein